MLGDDAVDNAALARIDSAQHLARALTSLQRHPRIRRHALAEHRVPETLDGGQSVRGQFVEQDEGAKGTAIIGIGEGDIIVLAP